MLIHLLKDITLAQFFDRPLIYSGDMLKNILFSFNFFSLSHFDNLKEGSNSCFHILEVEVPISTQINNFS